MDTLFLTILRALCLILGGLLIYLAVFLSEDEEKKIQNSLETLWLRVYYYGDSSLKQHTAFMKVVADRTKSVIEKIFGENIFSLKAVSVAAAYSWGACLLGYTIGASIFGYKFPRWAIIAGYIDFVLGTIPVFINNRLIRIAWLVSLLIYYFVMWPLRLYQKMDSNQPSLEPRYLGMFFGVPLGIVFCLLFVSVTRRILRWSSDLRSFGKISLVVFSNFVVAVSLVLLPALAYYATWKSIISAGTNSASVTPPFTVALFTAYSNTISIAVSLAFIMLALLMLIHRALWPTLQRLIYPLQRFGIARRNKLMGVTGVFLIGVALNPIPGWLEKLLTPLF